MIIFAILINEISKMLLAENDHLIKTLMFYVANETLGKRINLRFWGGF